LVKRQVVLPGGGAEGRHEGGDLSLKPE
jgi:hypothetical protein